MLNKAWRKFTIFDRIQVINEKTDFGDDTFFVLDTKWVDWSTQNRNLIQYINFQTTVDFRYIAFNCVHETKQEMLVFSQDYTENTNLYSYLKTISIEIEDDSSQVKFVRNQRLKKTIIGVEQKKKLTICNVFFWQDEEQPIKKFEFQNDHPHAEQDVIIFFHDPKAKISKYTNQTQEVDESMHNFKVQALSIF